MPYLTSVSRSQARNAPKWGFPGDSTYCIVAKNGATLPEQRQLVYTSIRLIDWGKEMQTRFLIAVLAATMPALALAQGATAYQCSFGELQRRVEILTEPGVAVPCEVHYYKDTEAPGERQVLWSASSEAGYCERKTEEFIARLEGWGWNCSTGGGTPEAAPAPEAAPEPEPETMPEAAPDPAKLDETDDLSPAAETVSQA